MKVNSRDSKKGQVTKTTFDNGCGAHDPRPRRQRTRQGQKSTWKKDQGYERDHKSI